MPTPSLAKAALKQFISQPPIDIDTEQIIGVYEVGKHVPGPRQPARATGFRWVQDGVRVQGTDQYVKLPSVKLNGIRCTSIEAVRRFLRAANGQPSTPAITPTQRRRQAETASRVLQEAGV